MTSFLSIHQYSPFLVLGVGLSTCVGLWGLGAALLCLVRLRLPSPWEQPTALLLGVQTLSLAVQITGVLEIASRSVLITIWWSLVAIGASMLLLRGRQVRIERLPIRWRHALCCWPAMLPIMIVAVAVATNILVALAPSSKIDELYYHMLIPSRIVSDGALAFYREPWEGAIWPQMVFQMSAAPVHAIGYPDSTNIVSLALSLSLLGFAWRIIRANANTVSWTALCVGSLCVGLYPSVWHVTGGAHAMGDLALAAAIVAFCNRERLLISLAPWAYAALLSILLLSASTSKISLLPLGASLLCLAVWPLSKSALPRARLNIALAVAVPWIIFYGPIVWWTWTNSGSPFGPVLAAVFGPSVYPRTWLQQAFQATRDANQLPSAMIRNAAFGYSPLIWLGVIGALSSVNLAKVTRVILGCLFALQCTLIYWLLPYDVRFLSVHYGLFIAFASLAPIAIQERLASARVMFVACGLFLLPWLAVQTYYAKQFFSVSLGLEKTAFYERYIAFYTDYVKLDYLLPEDAVLLSPGFRLDAVYAPRPVFFDSADLPQGKPVALFDLGETAHVGVQFKGYRLGKLVYRNDQAVIRTYRTPGRAPIIGPLKVVTLIKD